MSTLAQRGVDYTKINYVPVPLQNMQTLLDQHRVDAADMTQPFMGVALKTGNYRFLGDEALGIGPYGTVVSMYCTSASYQTAHPDVVKKFAQAMAQANAYANAHPSDVRALLPSFTGVTPAQAQATVLGIFPPKLDVQALQKQATLNYKFQFISSPIPNISKFISPGAQVIVKKATATKNTGKTSGKCTKKTKVKTGYVCKKGKVVKKK